VKIIEPSYEIIEDHLAKKKLNERIEECGRICYKSEDKITPKSAGKFIRGTIAKKHNSVLEMGVVTLYIQDNYGYDILPLCSKYIVRSRVKGGVIVTGSVRAFREVIELNAKYDICSSSLHTLCHSYNELFGDLVGKIPYLSKIGGINISHPGVAYMDDYDKHRHIAVKFIVNRAVSHEIVRHRPVSYLQESQRYCNYGRGKFNKEVTFIKPCFYEEKTMEYVEWAGAMETAEEFYFELLKTSSPQAARTVLPNSCKTEIIVYCNAAEWKHIFKLRCPKEADPSMREVMIPLRDEFIEREII
jgi:thymidylate synthase (FAD)